MISTSLETRIPDRGRKNSKEVILLSFAYVTEKGTSITHKEGRFVVSRNAEVLMEIPEETLDGLVLIDTVQVPKPWFLFCIGAFR